MLILTRKIGEVIYIGDDIQVIVIEIKGNQIRLGIQAPPNQRILRKEIYDQIQEENKAAADTGSAQSLDGITEVWHGNKESSTTSSPHTTSFSKFATGKVTTPSMTKRKKREDGE